MSLISRTAQYALRAMTLLASQDGRMTVRQLAKSVGAPQPYLARIIMMLADTGMVDARRGPGGGLRLGRKPEEISLMEIITCFDGKILFEECALGLPGCVDSTNKCPAHDQWVSIRDQIQKWWNETTLASFSSTEANQCMKDRVESLGTIGSVVSGGRGRWR
ncbi:Rrf2 family transcriptional regulator [bacterium]|nr:Rrf2 family transcriptional regulator [bacterium]